MRWGSRVIRLRRDGGWRTAPAPRRTGSLRTKAGPRHIRQVLRARVAAGVRVRPARHHGPCGCDFRDLRRRTTLTGRVSGDAQGIPRARRDRADARSRAAAHGLLQRYRVSATGARASHGSSLTATDDVDASRREPVPIADAAGTRRARGDYALRRVEP